MVDYNSLYSTYGNLIKEALRHEKEKENLLFLKLITNYGILLKGNKEHKVIKEKLSRSTHPTLQGRYFGYQILNENTENQNVVFKELMSRSKKSESILNFFFEVFPALIMQHRIDLISKILDDNYEELFNPTEWQHRNEEKIYLIGQTLVYLKEENYKAAKNSFSFIQLENLIDDYKDYFGIFYLLAKYHLIKKTSKSITELKQIEKDFLEIIKRTGFHYFNVNFLKNYFD
jgi:hypothetical protein